MGVGLTALQGEISTTNPRIWYVAPAGHRYMTGDTFQNAHDQAQMQDSTVHSGDSAANSYWAALKTDGSREIVGFSHGIQTSQHHYRAERLLDLFPDAHLHYIREHRNDQPDLPAWVDYDWATSTEEVNQIPYVQRWQPHVCLTAHDVDQFNEYSIEHRRADSYKIVPGGAHSAETQIRNQNTLQVFRAMIGDALRRLDKWANLPEAGDTGAFSTDWKQQLEGIRNIIENKLCQACQHQWSAREFARLHDYSAWRTILDHRRVLDEETGSAIMRVPVIVRDTEPWQPHATENLAFFGGTDLETGWRTAIEWYDEAVHRYDRLYAPRYPAV